MKVFYKTTKISIALGILCFLIFWSAKSNAQDSLYAWKKIPENDLKMEVYEQDPSADAVVLQQYVELKFGIWRDELRLFYEVNRRIKILTDDGKKYADVEIPFIGLENFEEITSLSGFTYNYENGNVKIHKLKLKGIQLNDSDEVIHSKHFKLPDVEVGSIIEYKYTLTTLNFIEPEIFYFQQEIPVRYSEFRANIPDIMSYKFTINGVDNLQYSEISESITNLVWLYRNEDPIPSGLNYHSRDFTVNMNLKLDSHYYVYSMSNIPAFQSELFIDSYLNYIYSISLNLIQVTQNTGFYSYIEQLAWKNVSKRLYQTTTDNYYILSKQKSNFKTYPAGYILYFTKTWDEFATQMINSEYFGLHLTRAWKNIKIVENLTNSDSSDIYNLKSIYNFVRDTVNWNDEFDIRINQSMEEVYTTKSGNGTEINMLLIQLLRKAGFEVNPVLVKTRSEGKPDLELPSVSQFNHVIAAAEVDNQVILLDATEKRRPYFVLNFNDLNGYGFLLKKIGSEWIEIQNYKPTGISYSDTIILTEIDAEMKRQIEYSGYYAYDNRILSLNQQNLFTFFDQSIFEESAAPNYPDDENNLILRYSVKTEKMTYTDKNSITFNPFTHSSNFMNSFESMFRINPVNFGLPFFENYTSVISIPDGYQLRKISDFQNYTFGNNDASLLIDTLLENPNKLVIKINLNINKTEYPLSQYYLLRDLFEEYSDLSDFFIYFEKI